MKQWRLSISPLRAMAAVVFLALLAIPAFFAKGVFGFCPLLFAVFLLLLSLVYGILAARGLSIAEISEHGSCIRGETVPLSVSVQNKTCLVCLRCRAVFYTSDLSGGVRSRQELSFTLAPRESRTFSFRVLFDHVGVYSVGVESLHAESLLGIVAFVRKEEPCRRTRVSVLPRLYAIERLELSERIKSESVYSNLVSSAESVDCAGVREYAFGDPIKLIHWKLSSHAGSYVTKLLESYGNHGLTIIPETECPPYDGETLLCVYDALIECCASLQIYAEDLGMDAELLYHDTAGAVCKQSFDAGGQFQMLLQAIPRLQTEETRASAAPLLRSEASSRYANSNAAVCTAFLDENLALELLQMSRAGIHVMLFYIRPLGAEKNRPAAKALHALQAGDIPVWTISSAAEIGKAVQV